MKPHRSFTHGDIALVQSYGKTHLYEAIWRILGVTTYFSLCV